MFNVETDSGVATARINGKYIDAAVVGGTAGLEFSVDKMHMFDAPRQHRHAPAVMTLDCAPATLLQLVTVILTKLGLPAFTGNEWREIAAALADAPEDYPEDLAMRLLGYAKQINESADKIAAL